MVQIKKYYQLKKDLDNPNIVYMPQSMRDEMTQEFFDKNYTNKTIGKIGLITVKVISDNKTKKKKSPKSNNKTKKKQIEPVQEPVIEPVIEPEPVQEPVQEQGKPLYRNAQLGTIRTYNHLDWFDKNDHSKGKVMPLYFYQYLVHKGIYESDYESKGHITIKGSNPVINIGAEPQITKAFKRTPKIVIVGRRTIIDSEEKEKEEEKELTPVSVDGYDFLYPELDDPNFNIKIAQRKEFNDAKYDGAIHDVKIQSEILCNADFELMPHQQFVKNFLSIQTPYNSLLLYHGLGTGKTCSAIGVAEEMRNYMKQIGLRKKIMIIAMPNVQDNFRLQLFDPRKLKLDNGLWTIESCIGNSLLREINPTGTKGKESDRDTMIEQINGIIGQYYDFMGYTQFANYISSIIEVKGNLPESDKLKIKSRQIKSVFNNRLVIIDEAHNIRITNENKNKKAAELLMDVAKHSDNMRLLLLSATPMYNSYEEIVWLVNMLNLNDKRGQIAISDIFENNGIFKPDGLSILKRKLTGYVSYIRGENPYTFPYRIYPDKDPNFVYPTRQLNDKAILEGIRHVPIYVNKINEYQEKGYKKVIEDMRTKGEIDEMETFKYTLLMLPVESLNIIYPYDDTTNIEEITGKSGLSRVMDSTETASIRYNFKYKDPNLRIFNRTELPKYSAKMANICEIISKSEGIILVYSQYIDGGSVPMALALEEMGFTRYGSDKQTRSLFATPPTQNIGMKYVMITGDKMFSPNNDKDIKKLNAPDNIDGSKIKVVLISKAAGEGIDFKNIRQIHIMEPWYNMNRIEQIIGRGVRNQSHCKLPFEKRNVEIFLHATSLTDATEESADMYVYRLAEKKSIEIGKVTRILKETAVDCILNIGQTNFTTENMAASNTNVKLILSRDKKEIDYTIGDKPYTELCDYMDNCAFTCSPTADIEVTEITYNENFVEINNDTIIKRIRDLFKDVPKGRHFYKRDDLFNSINIVKSYPDAQIFSALTYLIDNKNEHITDRYGRIGNLVNHGEYYLFQPIEITDDAASIYERTRPIDFKMDYVNIKMPEKEKEKEKDKEKEKETDTIIKQIIDNLDMAFGPLLKYNDKNWYNAVNVMKDYLIKNYLTETQFKEYVVYHNLDSIGLSDTLVIMNQLKDIPALYRPIIEKYFKDKRITAKDGTIGIVLRREDKPYIFYTQNESGKWEPVTNYSVISKFMNSPDYTSKYIIDKRRLNRLFGFMSWIPAIDESIFKIRDLESTVNTIGARVDQAQVKDIIAKLNAIVRNNTIYTSDNIKDIQNEKTYIGEGKRKMVVILEMILRYNNENDTIKLNEDKAKLNIESDDYKTRLKELNDQYKIWFITSEQIDINKIQDLGKKNKIK